MPLPVALTRAQLFLSERDGQAISDFSREQIGRLEGLVSASTPTGADWSALIPPAIRPVAGKLMVAPFLSLMDLSNLGGLSFSSATARSPLAVR